MGTKFLTKLDVKAAFLQTGRATWDIYVVPTPESSNRGKVLWLLLKAAYELEIANLKISSAVRQGCIQFQFCFSVAGSAVFFYVAVVC